MSKSTDLTVVKSLGDLKRWTMGKLQEAILEEDGKREEATMREALLIRHVHDEKRWKEDGHDSFKDWCESIDRTETWGHYMVRAAEHFGRVENPRQARELTGLSEDEADAVVDAAKDAGPVTSKTLGQARRELAVGKVREAARQIETDAAIRYIAKKLNNAREKAATLGGDFPDWWFESLDKCREYVSQQGELSRAA